MKSYTVGVGSIDAFSAKKRRYSSTAVGFPIRDDLSGCLQGISATFPTWARARLACIYVRDLGICFDWAKKNPLCSILSPDIHAAYYANSARYGRENSHTAPLFVPACMMGWRTVHHANTTLATPCGASKLSERQGNSLLVSLQLAWELLASLFYSHWRTIPDQFYSHWRTIRLTLANYSIPYQPTLSSQTNPPQPSQTSQPNPSQPTQPDRANPTKPTQPNQAKPTKPTQSSQTNPIQLTLANHSTHIGEPFNSHWTTIQLTFADTLRRSSLCPSSFVARWPSV